MLLGGCGVIPIVHEESEMIHSPGEDTHVLRFETTFGGLPWEDRYATERKMFVDNQLVATKKCEPSGDHVIYCHTHYVEDVRHGHH